MEPSSAENKPESPPKRKAKSICLPFEHEASYPACMSDPARYRAYIMEQYAQHPELFPKGMEEGFTFHDILPSRKQNLCMRRIKLKRDGEVYQLRPSFMMPYMIGRIQEVEKALYYRRWGVPFDALAYGFGRDPMYWYRAYVSLGRCSVVGTTIKDPDQLPEHVVADEKHSRHQGNRVYIPTTVAQECILGAEVAESAGEEDLKKGYQVFRDEARQLQSDYTPRRSIPMDGTPRRTPGKPSFRWSPSSCVSYISSSTSRIAVGPIKDSSDSSKTKSGRSIRRPPALRLPNAYVVYASGFRPEKWPLPSKRKC